MNTKINFIIFLTALFLAVYFISHGIGKIDDLGFGAGAFYYTDIPNWQERFFGRNSVNLGTRHPFLFLFIFGLWGYLCFKALLWIDRK